MKKLVVSSMLLLGLVFASRHPASPLADRAIGIATGTPSATAVSPVSGAVIGESAFAAERRVLAAYLETDLEQPGETTARSLAALGAGLTAGDEGTRRAAAVYVENLLILVASGKRSVHPENQGALKELIALYKTNAQDQIQRTQKACPQCPTLAFLQNN